MKGFVMGEQELGKLHDSVLVEKVLGGVIIIL